jgi:hypothetical protein
MNSIDVDFLETYKSLLAVRNVDWKVQERGKDADTN